MNEKNEKKKFKPNPKQLKFSQVFLNYSKPRSNKEIAKEIGVSTMTLYRWKQQPEFTEWLNSLAKDLLKKSLAKRYLTAIRLAENGNYNFSKLLMEIQGEYIPQSRQKLEGSQEPVQITVVDVSLAHKLKLQLIKKVEKGEKTIKIEKIIDWIESEIKKD